MYRLYHPEKIPVHCLPAILKKNNKTPHLSIHREMGFSVFIVSDYPNLLKGKSASDLYI